MTTLSFSLFQSKVQKGSKCRTYREAKCVHERRRCKGIHQAYITKRGDKISPPQCYLVCPSYEYRIKPGDLLHLYTGLYRKDYCTNKESQFFGRNVLEYLGYVVYCIPYTENYCSKCKHRGALLLRPDLPKCISSKPVKFKDITEEDAKLDGFEEGYQPGACIKICGRVIDKMCSQGLGNDKCSSRNKMRLYFNAKPDTILQEIVWGKLKE